MYLMPLLATLISSVFAGAVPLVAHNLGQRGVSVFSIVSLFIAFISSALIWIDLYIGGATVSIDLFGPWFEVGTVTASWTFYYDLLTAHMLFTVTGVSLAVHIFAVVYMRSDPHITLFMAYLSLFTFFMLVYVCADNFLVMLVGWEGIGICSYLLIGYYSHRLSAVKSAQKAILVNRISDGMLLWGVLWIWYYTGSLEYDLALLNPTSSISMFIVISVLIGAMGKSAQILFHVWLADAMEGPTPVSALIHAATLVTAGIYLMVRLGPFMAGSDLVILVGCCTAFMAGVFGFFQADLKRVIAFSTCSQLGYMMVSVGLGEFGAEASMAHLMTHASFKAALFLAAGVIIMSTNGNQHMARYGGLSVSHCSIFCFLTLLVGCLSLVGFPETSGFYSKEAILNLSYSFYNGGNLAITYYAHTLLYITALITACYTAKLFFHSFMADFSGPLFGHSPRHLGVIAEPFSVIADKSATGDFGVFADKSATSNIRVFADPSAIPENCVSWHNSVVHTISQNSVSWHNSVVHTSTEKGVAWQTSFAHAKSSATSNFGVFADKSAIPQNCVSWHNSVVHTIPLNAEAWQDSVLHTQPLVESQKGVGKRVNSNPRVFDRNEVSGELTLFPLRGELAIFPHLKKASTSLLLIVAMSILLFDIILKIWVGTSLLSGILLFIPWGVKTLPFGLVIAGAFSATALAPGSSSQLYILRFSATRWGFDQLYARSIVNMVLDWGRISWAAGDKGLFLVPNQY